MLGLLPLAAAGTLSAVMVQVVAASGLSLLDRPEGQQAMIYNPSQPHERVLGVRNAERSRLLWQASALRDEPLLYLPRLLITGKAAYTTTRKPFCSSAAINRARWARERLGQQQQQQQAEVMSSSSSKQWERSPSSTADADTEEGFTAVRQAEVLAAGYGPLQQRLGNLVGISFEALNQQFKLELPGLAPVLRQGHFKYLLLPWREDLTGLFQVSSPAVALLPFVVHCWVSAA
jgi:hypothetical protein